MTICEKIKVGDIDIFYKIEGPTHAPVVMLCHGILTDQSIWDQATVELSKSFRVLRYDLRGHGNSQTSNAPYTMSQLADDAVALADALKLHKFHFIGTSLGGMIGQQLGARFGDRLLSLTLSNTTAVQPSPIAWIERIEIAKTAGLLPLVEPTVQRWLTQEFIATEPPELAKLRQLIKETSVDGFIGCATAVRDLSQAHLLEHIQIPTLVIAGESDTTTPLDEAQRIIEGIKSARLVELPAAHQAAVECPQAFVSAWRLFISEIDHKN